MSTYASELKERAAFKRGDCDWWRYTWPLHKEWYDRKRILCPFLAPSNRFALDLGREYIGLTDTTVLFEKGQPEDLRYFIGLLNSRLLTFRFKNIGKLKSNGILEYFWNSISKLPIRRIHFSDRSDIAHHDRLVELVEQMLSLHKRLTDAKLPHDKTMLQQQIGFTDKQIDRIVYELYGLTEEEIKIVEAEPQA